MKNKKRREQTKKGDKTSQPLSIASNSPHHQTEKQKNKHTNKHTPAPIPFPSSLQTWAHRTYPGQKTVTFIFSLHPLPLPHTESHTVQPVSQIFVLLAPTVPFPLMLCFTAPASLPPPPKKKQQQQKSKYEKRNGTKQQKKRKGKKNTPTSGWRAHTEQTRWDLFIFIVSSLTLSLSPL